MVHQRANKTFARAESGQATIEFILTFLLLASVTFFFVQMCFVMAYGSYVQYATFMSARAYLSAGPTQEDQYNRASEVLSQMLRGRGGDRFKMFGAGEGGGTEIPGASIGNHGDYIANKREFGWLEGVTYHFKSKLLPIRLNREMRQETIELQSESWLGREPSYGECADAMGQKNWKFDNGC